MARVGGLPLPTITDDRAFGSADIQRSLRFNKDDSSKLSRTFGTNTSNTTKTISFWLKRGKLGSSGMQNIFCTALSGYIEGRLRINTDDTLQFEDRDASGGTSDGRRQTTQVLRDTNSWYHIMLVLDSTLGTEADRAKIYVNGTQSTIQADRTISQNYSFSIFRGNAENYIGEGTNEGSHFDGYLAEVNFIDGQALGPEYFGFTESQTGLWMPKRYEGTYGTNGFYLDFSDNSSAASLGIDKSPNGNDFTVNSPIAITDSMLDTPTNAFCTWNRVATDNRPDIQEGNLKNMGTNNTACNGTIGVTSGKWYWEQYCLTDISSSSYITTAGVTKYVQENDGDVEPRLAYTTGRSFYRGGSTGGYYNYKNYNQTSSTEVNSGGTYWGGAVVSFRLDMDAGTLKYYTNNTLVHTDSTIPTDGTRIFPMNSNTNSGVSRYNSIVSNFGQDSSFAGNKTAQGNTDENGIGDFYYPVPSGFRALNAKNLPKPTTSILNPNQHFDVLTWTGNGSTGQNITGLNFKPDLLWIKKRNEGESWGVYDSIRGVNKRFYLNESHAEQSETTMSAFNKDGFRVEGSGGGATNDNNDTYVGFCWKAGGASVSNTDGSVTTTISANPEAGFSIVDYNGGGNGSTMGHGLGAVPHWIIIKKRDTDSPGGARGWAVFHRSLPTDKALRLNSSTTQLSEANFFREDLMSTTVFGVNGDYDTGYSGDDYIAYVWTEIPGFSKFGSYTGNASTDGTYVHCGFRPAFVLTKMYDTMNENWTISDSTRSTFNPVDLFVRPDETTGDTSGAATMDFLSNGFKLRNTDDKTNRDGGNFIFAAFAEQPVYPPFDSFPNAR